MTDSTNDTTATEREELAELEKKITSSKGLDYLTAYGAKTAARELRAIYYREQKAGKTPDVDKLLRIANEHLRDEAERLSKAKPKLTDDKPEAKAKKPAPKKPLTPEEHRKAVAKKFAEATWKEQRRKQSEAKPPAKKETPDERRNRIAKSVLQYRVPATKKAS